MTFEMTPEQQEALDNQSDPRDNWPEIDQDAIAVEADALVDSLVSERCTDLVEYILEFIDEEGAEEDVFNLILDNPALLSKFKTFSSAKLFDELLDQAVL